MKNLLIKIVIFTVLLLVTDYIIGIGFDFLSDKVQGYPVSYGNVYVKAVNSINDDVVIIGESRAHHHFIPSVISDSLNASVVNMAKDGSSMTQQAAIIRMMLNRHTPKLLIWEVNPLGLMDEHLDEELETMMELSPFYSQDSLVRVLINQRSKYEEIKMISKAYRNNNKLTDYLLVISEGKHTDILKGYAPLPVTKPYPSRTETVYKDDVSREKIELLKNTLMEVQKKGCGIVLVSSPQWEPSNLNETRQAIVFDSLAYSMSVPFLNHRNDDRFTCDSTYYKDRYHLNDNGAIAYMQFFIPELKKVLKNTTDNGY